MLAWQPSGFRFDQAFICMHPKDLQTLDRIRLHGTEHAVKRSRNRLSLHDYAPRSGVLHQEYSHTVCFLQPASRRIAHPRRGYPMRRPKTVSAPSVSRTASRPKEVVIDGVRYVVDVGRREALRNNVYLDAIRAGQILSLVAGSGSAIASVAHRN